MHAVGQRLPNVSDHKGILVARQIVESDGCLGAFRETGIDPLPQVPASMPIFITVGRYPRLVGRSGDQDPGQYKIEIVRFLVTICPDVIAPVRKHQGVGRDAAQPGALFGPVFDRDGRVASQCF